MQQSKQSSTNPSFSGSKKQMGLWIIGFLAICLIVGGLILVFNHFDAKKGDKNVNVGKNSEEIEEEELVNKSINKESKNDLRSWIQKKTGVKCEVNDVEGGKMTISAKDNKIKIEGLNYIGYPNVTDKNKSTMITDGEWSYVWIGKNGNKFNLKDMEKIDQKISNEKNQNDSLFKSESWENLVNEIESSGSSYNCDEAVLSDDDFKIPTDVVFTDLGKQMEEFLKIRENSQKNLPNF